MNSSNRYDVVLSFTSGSDFTWGSFSSFADARQCVKKECFDQHPFTILSDVNEKFISRYPYVPYLQWNTQYTVKIIKMR